jgi:hypothetical protein
VEGSQGKFLLTSLVAVDFYWHQLSEIFHDLKKIAFGALSTKQKEAIVGIRVEGTGRVSQVPPLIAPYDFGIDWGWWRGYSKKYPNHVSDFYKHPGPPDFAAIEEGREEDDAPDNRNGEEANSSDGKGKGKGKGDDYGDDYD